MRKLHFDFRYETLAEVLRQGGYSAAGKTLSLTASAVAHQIHSLEDELGVRLFVNRGGRLHPTPECEAVSRYLSRIDALCDQMTEELSNPGADRHVTVGLTPSIESGALSRMLSENQTRIDGIHITVRIDAAQKLREMLVGGAIDFAVVDGSMEDPDFNSVILDTDYLGAVVPAGSKYARSGMISPEELIRERLILRPAGSGTRSLFEANLKRTGIPADQLRVMMEVNSVATVKKLVAEGFGISLLSEKVCRKEILSGTLALIPVSDWNLTRNIRLYYRKDSAQNDLLQFIRTVYANILTETEEETV